MPRISINFRQALAQGQGGINDRLDEHVLGMVEAASAKNVSIAKGTLTKGLGWQRLVGITPSGAAITIDADAEGISFPDHADYDLGLRWTIDVAYKVTSLPAGGATHAIVWRADDSNNRISCIEIDENGNIVGTHRDSAGTVDTVTSTTTFAAGETAFIRLQRFYDSLYLKINGVTEGTNTTLSATLLTAAADNKLYVGVSTVTNGDTTTAAPAARGTIDEVRIFRDEIRDEGLWSFSEWPWFLDYRLVLLARFNEASGTPVDSSKNGNDGTVIGSVTQGAAALVTPLAPIRKAYHMRTSTGIEQWCLWAADSFYGEDVI